MLLNSKLFYDCKNLHSIRLFSSWFLLFTQNAAVKDAALPQMLKHIEQLKPLLQANEDVILSVQIGFIGVWGKFIIFVFLKYF